jgi:lipoprotein-releasing system permease protein
LRIFRTSRGAIEVLPVKIALRFLSSSKYQTVLIMVGLGIGIAVQIFVGSLLQNLQAGFLDEFTGDSAHVTVLPDGDNLTISDWEAMVHDVETVDGVSYISASADFPALMTSGQKSSSVLVRGFDFQKADKIYEINEALYDGRLPDNSSELMVGLEQAEEFSLKLNDRVTLVTADTRTVDFWVAGLFDFGTPAVNERWVLMTLEASQTLFMVGNTVTSIEIQVEDVFAADSIADTVASKLPAEGIAVENWIDNNPDFFSALNAQGASSYMIQTFVLMSVVIGIAAVLSISVVQKSRQIGILKAMGIKDRSSSQVFMFMGLFLGIGGAVVGVSLGSVLFYGFVQAISSDGDSIIKANFNFTFILGSGVVAVLSALFASLIPALKSSRLNPIEVIRNG